MWCWYTWSKRLPCLELIHSLPVLAFLPLNFAAVLVSAQPRFEEDCRELQDACMAEGLGPESSRHL